MSELDGVHSKDEVVTSCKIHIEALSDRLARIDALRRNCNSGTKPFGRQSVKVYESITSHIRLLELLLDEVESIEQSEVTVRKIADLLRAAKVSGLMMFLDLAITGMEGNGY